MEAARPRGRRRPPRRGTVDRPLNARLVRVSSLIVVPALLALLFSVSATGTLPRPPLEPLFDQDTAASLVNELTSQFPSRIPGTQGDVDAALWFSQSIAAFGLEVDEDVWSEDIPELGRVELHNVVAVIPGRSDTAVVLVAHRDNAGVTRPYGDNASGTAALIELARGFAPRGAAETPRPQRTLVLVSTDGGAYGGAGAARFAEQSPYADAAFAAIVLDGIAGGGHPRVAIAGDRPRSPAPALVRTALTRVEEQTGTEPYLAGIPTQLVDLGLPFAYAEQGRLLASSIAAVTLTTEEQRRTGTSGGRPGDGTLDRTARRHGPCDRGPRRLDRREPRRCVPHAGQRLPARPRRKRLGRATDAPDRRGAVRAGSARPARPNTPPSAPARAGGACAPYADPVLAVRGPPPLARRRRRDPPDRCRASAPDIRLRS